jgi:parallel beta-helix repeat protein
LDKYVPNWLHPVIIGDTAKKVILPLLLLLIFCVGKARGQEPVLIGGLLTESQVWTKQYVYIVTDDIRVPDNIELVIEAGTTVRFNQGTGIIVELGSLRINGQVDDSVRLVPNYIGIQQWKWRGISYQKATGEGLNHVRFARIVNAEVGLEMVSATHVVIENVHLSKNQWRGIRLVNSEYCTVRDCEISNNYVGIEIYASGSGNVTRNNLVTDSYIGANLNANITLLNENEGLLAHNIIERNLIEKTLNGIRFDRGSNAFAAENHIRLNKFIENGQGVGFGIYLTMDSTRIVNNIFWHNSNALTLRDASHCLIEGNSFLENTDAISLQTGAQNVKVIRNTLVKNDNRILVLNAAPQEEIAGNNFFRQISAGGYFRNNTAVDIDATGNFWASTETDTINGFIWDKLDSPSLGLISFEPILATPDTLAPVSPPNNFFKQLINGQVVFSWEASVEEDVEAYRLHYGPFYRYSFPFQTDTTSTTSIIIQGISIADSVALTAFDKQGFGSEEQLLGYESPFVFPEIIPYAGPDFSVCKNVKSIEITASTVPYAHDQIIWSTAGDGLFDDANVLYPNYYPGPADHASGSVVLTLDVLKNGRKKSDSFILSFIDLPYAYAGNDTILSPDSSLFLGTATAGFYDVLSWESTGDGVFNDTGLLQPTYYPGAEDRFRGEVLLILSVESSCGIVRDTLRLSIIQLYRISGTVHPFGETDARFTVLAIRTDGAAYQAASAVLAEESGLFEIKNLFKGTYSLFVVADTLNSGHSGPSYYIRQIRWQDAWVFDLQADIFDVDIEAHPLLHRNQSGEGIISGRFLKPQDEQEEMEIYCQPWFGEPGEPLVYCQDGLANVTILLFNPERTVILDYTLTDHDGNFFFRNLPYGNYVIEAEKPGYISNTSPLLSLTPDNKVSEGIILEVENKTISVKILTGKDDTRPQLVVFPNPAGADELRLHVSFGTEGSYVIELLDGSGRILFKESMKVNGMDTVTIAPVSLVLSNGVYLIRISSENGSSTTQKVVIQ